MERQRRERGDEDAETRRGDAEKPATGVRGGREETLARRPTARGCARVVASRRELAARVPCRRTTREKSRRGTKRRGWREPREGPRDPRGEGEDPRANAGTRAYRNVPFAAEEERGQNMAAVSEPARLSWCGSLAR